MSGCRLNGFFAKTQLQFLLGHQLTTVAVLLVAAVMLRERRPKFGLIWATSTLITASLGVQVRR
jgi:hypothetical protein